MVKSLTMYMCDINSNTTYPDYVHEYYTTVSPKTYRAYFLLNRNYEIPQHVMENVYYE